MNDGTIGSVILTADWVLGLSSEEPLEKENSDPIKRVI